jgi:hypothetical protein
MSPEAPAGTGVLEAATEPLLAPETIASGSTENPGVIPPKTHRFGAGVAVGWVGYADVTAHPHVGIGPAQSLMTPVPVVQISNPCV